LVLRGCQKSFRGNGMNSDFNYFSVQVRAKRATLWIAVGMALALLSLMVGAFAERFV